MAPDPFLLGHSPFPFEPLNPALVRGFLCFGSCAMDRDPCAPTSETSPLVGGGGLWYALVVWYYWVSIN